MVRVEQTEGLFETVQLVVGQLGRVCRAEALGAGEGPAGASCRSCCSLVRVSSVVWVVMMVHVAAGVATAR